MTRLQKIVSIAPVVGARGDPLVGRASLVRWA